MKSTKSPSPSDKLPSRLAIGIILLIIFGTLFITELNHTISITQATHKMPDDAKILIVLGGYILLDIAYLIGKIIGIVRGKTHLHREQKAIRQTNPYQYYKELPNHFGIGVASLLYNSALENEKDIVAVILDLCAQGYLRLSKHSDHYIIYPQPNAPTSPLSNERYILDLIHQDKLSQLNYHYWYQCCVDDGVHLNLYQAPGKTTFRQASITISRQKPKNRTVIILIPIFLGITFAVFSQLTESPDFLLIIAKFLVYGSVAFLFLYAIIRSIINIGLFGRQISRQTYKQELEAHLTKTQKGVTELQKLLAFKSFLAQFNTFVDKNPEAVILWDRYLSYAQVFGLTREIMHSGYSQLVDNAAFKIDDINHITQHNLKIATKKPPTYLNSQIQK